MSDDWKAPVVASHLEEVKTMINDLILNKYKSRTISVVGAKEYSFADTVEWIGKVMRGEHRKPKEV